MAFGVPAGSIGLYAVVAERPRGGAGRRERCPRPARRADLLRIDANDPRFEEKHIRILHVDPRAHPVGVACTEGLDASEVCEDATSRAVDWLVHFEVMRVAVDERHLTIERLAERTKLVDVIGIGVPFMRVRLVLFVVEV